MDQNQNGCIKFSVIFRFWIMIAFNVSTELVCFNSAAYFPAI